MLTARLPRCQLPREEEDKYCELVGENKSGGTEELRAAAPGNFPVPHRREAPSSIVELPPPAVLRGQQMIRQRKRGE